MTRQNPPALIHHFLDQSACKWPNKTAFEFNDQVLTYADTQIQANKLAHCLIASGVGAGDRVGIYLNKSLEIPVAIYGILKAGAVFVPIDPGAPPSRVAFIITNCQIRHLVTRPERRRSLQKALDAGAELDTVIGIEADALGQNKARSLAWSDLENFPATTPPDCVTEQDLAYILYTSGSTGEPKGMMHTHRSGMAYAVYSGSTYGISPDDRLGNHSRLHFDMALFEFFTGPSRGATTVIIPEEAMIFPGSLAKLIVEARLTVWYSVPLALMQLMTSVDLENRPPPVLRWVIYAGEPFPTKHMIRLMQIWPKAKYSNVYGPAEVNQCTVYHIEEGSLDPDKPIPLGRVWEGATGRVEKEDATLTAPGEIGELLICSDTMMKGYWGRPDLTDRKIVMRNSLSGEPEKYYRTGDLVAYDEKGILHFHGRIDRQVKIRGYRLELDEVENALHGIPEIEEGAVILHNTSPEDKLLLAVIRLRKGASLKAAEVKKRLYPLLPAYAVPEKIVIREELPRTSTGKIDRRRLQADLPATMAPLKPS